MSLTCKLISIPNALIFNAFLNLALVIFLLLLCVVIISWKEKEIRATQRMLMVMIFLPSPFVLVWFTQSHYLAVGLAGTCLLLLGLFFFPFTTQKDICDDYPDQQPDERDTIFSRNELKPGSQRFKEYYSQKPDREVLDDAFRKEPGLLSEKSLFYHPRAFASAKASFFTVAQLKNAVVGPVNSVQTDVDPKRMGCFLKGWTHKLGAIDVGITRLQPYHFYSHRGRGDTYGKAIKSNHTYAIAFTVEMNREMVQPAPQASIVMESAQQYLDSGRIAVQVAAFLRSLGYVARAHIDGNYQVVCPLVARDSGLGELGRMGLLMTPKQGPRVRIAVVTTNLKLEPDTWKKDHSMLDFCNRCKKCAEVCPSKSIPFDSPEKVNGVRRWKINSETCFTYWCKAGTDCGRCMAVCPYSHLDNILHNFIRWGIRRSPFFRRLAIPLDDFFYGKKPAPAPLPKWLGKN